MLRMTCQVALSAVAIAVRAFCFKSSQRGPNVAPAPGCHSMPGATQAAASAGFLCLGSFWSPDLFSKLLPGGFCAPGFFPNTFFPTLLGWVLVLN